MEAQVFRLLQTIHTSEAGEGREDMANLSPALNVLNWNLSKIISTHS